MSKIIIIGTYFGKWPAWFPAFLFSCAKNETIEWLFFTDCDIPKVSYPNIEFKPMDLSQINNLASEKLGFRIQKWTYSQADLQPAYSVIFDEYIQGFDFWGHCDIDVVWGDIRNFITEEILKNYQIISCRKDYLAGHFTLWRNEPDTNTLFRSVPTYREALQDSKYRGLDEELISAFLRTQLITPTENCAIKVYWPEPMVVGFIELNNNPNGWYWDNGKIFDAKERERVYIHFQKWKSSMNHIDFQIGDQPARFNITKRGIWSHRPPLHELLSERFNWEGIRGSLNNFLGWSVKSFRLFKMVLLVKDIYWAQNLLANSISSRDVQYNRKTGRLYLKRLNVHIKKGQNLSLLKSYFWALHLINLLKARFYIDEQDELFVDVGALRASLKLPADIWHLKELFIDGTYNIQFTRPTVVCDIGMNVGLASLYFASQHDVVVLGFEPFKQTYDQALRNISLNPTLIDKVKAFNTGISDSNCKLSAEYHPKIAARPGVLRPPADYREGLDFVYEDIELADARDILDQIVCDYPGRDIVAKIDCEGSEYQIINRLFETGRLNLIEAIIMEWHRRKPEHYPTVIANQLSDSGFRVFLFTPHHHFAGMLYAVRANSHKSIPNS